MNTPQFQEVTAGIVRAMCLDYSQHGWAEGQVEYHLEPVEQEMIALRVACMAVSAAFDTLPNECHEPTCPKCLSVALCRAALK